MRFRFFRRPVDVPQEQSRQRASKLLADARSSTERLAQHRDLQRGGFPSTDQHIRRYGGGF